VSIRTRLLGWSSGFLCFLSGFPFSFGVDAPFPPCNSPYLQRAVIEPLSVPHKFVYNCPLLTISRLQHAPSPAWLSDYLQALKRYMPFLQGPAYATVLLSLLELKVRVSSPSEWLQLFCRMVCWFPVCSLCGRLLCAAGRLRTCV